MHDWQNFMRALAPWGRFTPSIERPAVTRQTQNGKQPVWAWPQGGPAKPPAHATHFSGGLFRVNEPADCERQPDGTYRVTFRRQAERWTGQLALILDDVDDGTGEATKAYTPPPIAPTARIRTRPGSEQWAYVFGEPCRDRAGLIGLCEALADAGHADAGGFRGNTALIRLGRLPGSQPPGKPHPAELVWADWSRLFPPDPDRIAAAMGLGPLKRRATPTAVQGTAAPPAARLAPEADPLLGWLATKGWTLGPPARTGWVPIRCPWVHEHTNGDTSGTAYLAARPAAFHCYHDACAHRHPEDVLEAFLRLGAPDVPLTGDPPVPVEPAPVEDAAQHVERGLDLTWTLRERWTGTRVKDTPRRTDHSVAFLLAQIGTPEAEIVTTLLHLFEHGACGPHTGRPEAARLRDARRSAWRATAAVAARAAAEDAAARPPTEEAVQAYLEWLEEEEKLAGPALVRP